VNRVVLENVTLRFGENVAVNDLSLEIPAGSFFSLLGPSGCGKTTTMRLIAGLETPDAGRIWIGDRLVFDAATATNVPPANRKLGMVFQNYALWPHMTVRDNILFGLKVRKVAKRDQATRLADVLERLQITELAGRFPNELSGGQQQRVALARELITGSRVILMDEPLSNLDAKLRIDMRVELKQLHEETGGTIIYVTHDQIEALTLSSDMAIMREGVLQQVAPPAVVFRQPANLFVASFMGNAPINSFDLELRAGRLHGAGWSLPAPALLSGADREGSLVTIAARPEELTLQPAAGPLTVRGTVRSVLPTGYTAFVWVAFEGGDQHATVEHDLRLSEVAAGDRVHVGFDLSTLHLFDRETKARL
jgi:multiple sugar transport system ATP-binding protein